MQRAANIMIQCFTQGLLFSSIFFNLAVCFEEPRVCTYNPLFLEGTCSAHRTDPAATLIENLFLSLAEADCNLANPCNYPPHYIPRDWEEFDFIVIGAGSAGSVVANRLSEIAEWTVLLIEAGGDPPKTSEVPALFGLLERTVVDWQYKTNSEEPNCLGMEGSQCNWPRGKMLGGCSSNNLLLYVRGNLRDYDHWESYGNTGWGYRDVLPYFKKSEDMRSPEVRSIPDFYFYHGVGGPLKVEDFGMQFFEPLFTLIAKGFSELGYFYNPDCNGKFQSGLCIQSGTLENGRRCSTAKAFLSPLRFRKNIKISKYSTVTKILIDEITKVAYGVEFRDGSGKITRVLAKKEVILSAGAINSPQLLMLSKIGPRNELSALGIRVITDLPVGKNLQDHALCCGLIFAIDYHVPRVGDIEDMFNFLLKYNSSSYSNNGINSLNVFIDTENTGTDYPNVQCLFFSFTKNSSDLVGFLDNLGLRPEIKRQFIDININSFIVILTPVLLNPRSRGRIQLKSLNPMDHPNIVSGYLSDSRDAEVLTRAIHFLRKFTQTNALKAAGVKLHQVRIENCSTFPINSRPYMECFLRHLTTTTYHPVGTCRMGPQGHPDAVVDPQLRVQGINRLRVIDASVMPTITRGNINAPTIMIAEKGSDLIKHTWLSTPHSGVAGFRSALPVTLPSY